MNKDEMIKSLNNVLDTEGDLELLSEYDGMLDEFSIDDKVWGIGNPVFTIEDEDNDYRYFALEDDEVSPESKRRLVL